ncbi:MAG: thiol reductant ABC exporter subunit CydD [Leucobacter sp.]
MKPFDARLMRYARGILPLLSWGTFLGVVRALAILAWVWSIAHLIAWYAKPIMQFDWQVLNIGRVFEGLEDHRPTWVALAITALAVRSGATWLMGLIAERGAATVKYQLRTRALAHIGTLGPGWLTEQSEATLTLKLSRGLDALDKYFSQYIPQLLLTVTVTPVLVVALFWADPLSALIVVIVFPIIPMFMILIGLATRGAQDQQWVALGALSKAYLDVMRGLETLKLFRREQKQVKRVAEITEEYRTHTMKVLRITFLSGFVLDLASTFSVALVAVTVGTRLVDGVFPLTFGLCVLLLVPEVFIPIRQVGAAFHASTEGLSAAQDVFDILETEPEPVTAAQPSSDGTVLSVRAVSVMKRGEHIAAPVTLSVERGECVALAGPSGVGKTSLLGAIMGTQPYEGGITRATFAWSGQRPGLLRGTIAANVALAATTPDRELVRSALESACIGDIDPERELGTSGEGLSGGQAQRVALARAIYRVRERDIPLLILDEPTSALDTATEARIIDTLQRLAAEGVGVLVVSHREAVLQAADRVIRMREAVQTR